MVVKKIRALIIAGAICTLGAVPFKTLAADEMNYARTLQYSLYLYDSNMCGNAVTDNSLTDWRDNCHAEDSAMPLNSNNTDLSKSFITKYKNVLDPDNDGYIDVSGGFHDAGDYVKFGLPQVYSATALGWGYYEFMDAYEETGQSEHIKNILTYFTEYLKDCTYIDDNGDVIAYCYQVGDGETDHEYWGAPEIQKTPRRAYFATQDFPATDIVAGAAAALAVNSINLNDSQALEYAEKLYKFADEHPNKAVGSDHAPVGEEYYASTSYEDNLAEAAAWLYTATGNKNYLEDAVYYLRDGKYDAPYWMYSWDDAWLGAVGVLAAKTNDSEYWNILKQTIDIWMKNYNSPEGYACIDSWGSARYNTNAQFISLIYHKYKNKIEYADWAEAQMKYLLGENLSNKCYVVGLNDNSVKYPHHAAASGLSDASDKDEHKYVLYGALVGGPDNKDYHVDLTEDYQYNEVSIDYNAGFAGACAGLYTFFSNTDDEPENLFESENIITINTNESLQYKILSGTKDYQWSSENDSIAKANNGLITGISPGTTIIKAESDNRIYSCKVVVLNNTAIGDINGDNIVDLVDLIKLNKYLIKSSTLNENEFNKADLNNDDKVNVFDSMYLRKILLNI